MAWKLGYYSILILTFFPLISVIFTLCVFMTFYSIKDTSCTLFTVIAFQFISNWALVVWSNNPCRDDLLAAPSSSEATWFCRRCDRPASYSVQHCPVCRRCWRDRDHHCFFLGTCISRRNMKYFLTFMMYTVFGGCVVLHALVPHMSRVFEEDGEYSLWRFLYPVMFVRWLLGEESLSMFLLSAMFGVLVSVVGTLSVYTVYQWQRVLSGNVVKSNATLASRNVGGHFRTVFGERGLLHLIIPMPCRR